MILVYLLLALSGNASLIVFPDPSTTVYVCNGPVGGKKFHYKESCRGLSTCQHKILKIKLNDAKKQGRTLCKWEK